MHTVCFSEGGNAPRDADSDQHTLIHITAMTNTPRYDKAFIATRVFQSAIAIQAGVYIPN